jgi:hypothetical protein
MEYLNVKSGRGRIKCYKTMALLTCLYGCDKSAKRRAEKEITNRRKEISKSSGRL